MMNAPIVVTPDAESLAHSLGAKRNGRGWRAKCPAHNDHSPSLDIDIGESGKPLITCRAGCSNNDVISALRDRGLWSQCRVESFNGRRWPDNAKPSPKLSDDPPPHPTLGVPDTRYDYYDAAGKLIGAICRWDRPNGKEIRPVTHRNGAWVWEGFERPRPLFQLGNLLSQKDAPVLVVEGEKTAIAARELVSNCVAITWAGGTNAVQHTDWTPLKGRDVILWPDNDEAGRKAMRGIADLLTDARSVRGVKVPDGLPTGWDLGDSIPADLDPVALVGSAVNVITNRASSLPIKKASEIDAANYSEIRWAIPTLIPEGCTILAGPKSRGKSFIALDFALAVATGGCALGNIQCEQGDVLYLALEDSERRIKARQRAILQGRPAPDNLDVAVECPTTDNGAVEAVEDWIKSRENPRLIIVDVLAKVKGKPDRDRGVYDQDYATIGPWHALARRRQVAIILVHHTNKGIAADPVMRISGTMGLSGACDSTLVLSREAREMHGTLDVRGRDIPEREIALQFDAETGCVVQLGAADDFRKSEQRREILRALNCSDDPLKPVEIAEAIGKKRPAVRYLLSEMHKAGEVSKLPNGKYYATQ